jgi:hypothetical protein
VLSPQQLTIPKIGTCGVNVRDGRIGRAGYAPRDGPLHTLDTVETLNNGVTSPHLHYFLTTQSRVEAMQTSDQITHLLPGLKYPIISYGLPFPEACAKHVKTTVGCSRVYAIVSGTLSRTTDAIERLEAALGREHLVGVRKGMRPHTLYSEVLEIAAAVERLEADCIVTVGGGSLIDGAKIIPFVSMAVDF